MNSPIQNKSHGNMPHYMGGLNADDSQNERELRNRRDNRLNGTCIKKRKKPINNNMNFFL